MTGSGIGRGQVNNRSGSNRPVSRPRSEMAANGATPPLGPALGKDGCPCFADLHHHDLRPGEPPESQLDGGEGNERGQGFGKVLVVFGKPPISAEP
jgi:hypothetical protein